MPRDLAQRLRRTLADLDAARIATRGPIPGADLPEGVQFQIVGSARSRLETDRRRKPTRGRNTAAPTESTAPCAELHRADFFSWAEQTTRRFDCAAGNPPFIRYQTFKGEVRRRALDLCAELGAPFSALTFSWAPFLVVTASLLQAGGRMAFVVPASIGHAPYAAPLIEYLVVRFDLVRIVPIRQKLFPHLSEDCWLLFADGFGGSTGAIHFAPIEHFGEFELPAPAQVVPVSE